MHNRNFSDRWLLGADSVRTSNIRDHAHSEQHAHVMNILEKQRASNAGQSLLANAHIALALNTSHEEKIRLKHKFDIAYFLAIEKLSFCKFPCVCELEVRHGISIGSSYTTEIASQTAPKMLPNCISEYLILKIFLDGMPPDPPSRLVLTHCRVCFARYCIVICTHSD